MEGFFGFLKFGCGGIVLLGVAFLVMLSLPKSRLRSVVLEIGGWFTTAAAATSVVSPIDMIPDLIPVLGWTDDFVAILVGVGAVFLALHERKVRQQIDEAQVRQLN